MQKSENHTYLSVPLQTQSHIRVSQGQVGVDSLPMAMEIFFHGSRFLSEEDEETEVRLSERAVGPRLRSELPEFEVVGLLGRGLGRVGCISLDEIADRHADSSGAYRESKRYQTVDQSRSPHVEDESKYWDDMKNVKRENM